MRASGASRRRESGAVPRAADPATLARRHERDRVTGSSAGLEHEPREPRGPRTLVAGDVLRETGVKLPEKSVASRSAAAMNDARRRLEENPPTATAQPGGEIALFRVKEEALVESSDVLECRSADEHGRTFHGLDRVRGRVVLPRRRVAAKRTAAAREERQARALTEDSPQRREPQNGRLKSSVRVGETWPDRGSARITFQSGHEGIHRSRLNERVGVQQQKKGSVRLPRPAIAGGPVAAVLRFDEEPCRRRCGKPGRDRVPRGVVDDHDLSLWRGVGKGARGGHRFRQCFEVNDHRGDPCGRRFPHESSIGSKKKPRRLPGLSVTCSVRRLSTSRPYRRPACRPAPSPSP